MDNSMYDALLTLIKDVKEDTRDIRELARATNGRVTKLESRVDIIDVKSETAKALKHKSSKIDAKTLINGGVIVVSVILLLIFAYLGIPLPIVP